MALAHVIKTIREAIVHPLVVKLLTKWLIFGHFLSRVCTTNMLLQYVNSMNCIVRSGGGGILVGNGYMVIMTHSVAGLHQALEWHLWVPHVHGSSHVGNVFA